jgi:alanyl-tRNA synthetase
MRRQADTLEQIGRGLKAKPGQEAHKVEELSVRARQQEKELGELLNRQAGLRAEACLEQASTIGGYTCLITRAGGMGKKELTVFTDVLASRLRKAVAVITNATPDSLSIIALVGEEARSRVKAGNLVAKLAVKADGRGGGRPDRAQAGSKKPEKEAEVLEEAEKILKKAFS